LKKEDESKKEELGSIPYGHTSPFYSFGDPSATKTQKKYKNPL